MQRQNDSKSSSLDSNLKEEKEQNNHKDTESIPWASDFNEGKEQKNQNDSKLIKMDSDLPEENKQDSWKDSKLIPMDSVFKEKKKLDNSKSNSLDSKKPEKRETHDYHRKEHKIILHPENAIDKVNIQNNEGRQSTKDKTPSKEEDSNGNEKVD